MTKHIDANALMQGAVKHFWIVRGRQLKKQRKGGKSDQGARGAVTGGKHADGFVKFVGAVVSAANVKDAEVRLAEKRPRTLPGYFRPCKEWDLLVVRGTDLVAAIEVKSQVGSFGNNFNNRVEEALGNAADFWAAYKNGLFAPTTRPWLGYLFMLEERDASTKPTKQIDLKPFRVDPVFQQLSYARRYEETCKRLVRERLYDAACFFTSEAATGIRGVFKEPSVELSAEAFARSLYERALAFRRIK